MSWFFTLAFILIHIPIANSERWHASDGFKAPNQVWHQDLLFDSKQHGKEDFIPTKTNIAIVLDVTKEYHNCTYSLLHDIIYGLSLAAYRISLYTTADFYVDILNFQSRKCLLQQIKNYRKRSRRLFDVLDDVFFDMYNRFSTEKQILLIVVDKEISNMSQKIKHLMPANTKAYIMNVAHAQRKLDEGATNEKAFKDILGRLNFVDNQLYSCKEEQKYVSDECGRQCRCINGKKVNCYRIRKEFSSLDLGERMRYIYTYKELFNNKMYQSDFNDYLHYHKKYFYKGIHKSIEFFPWHRKYLLGYENLLRLVNCHVTVPFWNWALYSDIAWSISPSYHMWSQIGGFGGNGEPAKAYCVDSGYFEYRKWNACGNKSCRRIVISKTCDSRDPCLDGEEDCEEDDEEKKKHSPEINKCVDTAHLFDFSSCLRRRFFLKPPSYQSVFDIYKEYGPENFHDIDSVVREDWHNEIHNKVGGHMETSYSSYAPEFWLHHGFLDAFWDKWQKKGKEYESEEIFDNVTSLIGFVPEENGKFYLRNDNLAGCGIKIRYENVFPFIPKEKSSGSEY